VALGVDLHEFQIQLHIAVGHDDLIDVAADVVKAQVVLVLVVAALGEADLVAGVRVRQEVDALPCARRACVELRLAGAGGGHFDLVGGRLGQRGGSGQGHGLHHRLRQLHLGRRCLDGHQGQHQTQHQSQGHKLSFHVGSSSAPEIPASLVHNTISAPQIQSVSTIFLSKDAKIPGQKRPGMVCGLSLISGGCRNSRRYRPGGWCRTRNPCRAGPR
jgi:hypothetical protein